MRNLPEPPRRGSENRRPTWTRCSHPHPRATLCRMLDETLLKAARAACEAQSVRELADVAVSHVRCALSAANALMFSFGPQGLQGEGGELAQALSGYTAELFEQDVIQQTVLRAKRVATPTAPTLWRSLDLRAHKRSAAYADFYRPFDIEHFICVHLNELPYGSDGMRGILFCRSQRQQPFCQTDIARVASVTPFLRAARGRIELFEQTNDKLRILEALTSQLSDRPALLLDERAQVLWMSDGAQRLLWDEGVRKRCSLPEALVRATEQLLAPARGRRTGPWMRWVEVVAAEAEPLQAQLELLPLANGQRTVLVRLAKQPEEATALRGSDDAASTPCSHAPAKSPMAATLTTRPMPERPRRLANSTWVRPNESTLPPSVSNTNWAVSTSLWPGSPAGSSNRGKPPSLATLRSPVTRRAFATLTPAEREVLTLLRHGLNNRAIAQQRSVSLETVRTHVRRILSKLGVNNRSQAALIAQALSEHGDIP